MIGWISGVATLGLYALLFAQFKGWLPAWLTSRHRDALAVILVVAMVASGAQGDNPDGDFSSARAQ